MHPHDNQTYYQILGISPDANREEIEKACVELWYKYQPMRGMPLWAGIAKQIDHIHSTLVNPDARAAYDKSLAAADSERVSITKAEVHHGDETPFSAGGSVPEEISTSILDRMPKVKFRNVLELDALAAAFGFNQSVDWLRPEGWSDIATAAWLALFFCLAGTLLIWSILHLLKAKRTSLAATISPGGSRPSLVR